MDFLLNDEKEISKEDLEIRKKLYEEFMDLPVTFVSKMRHFQPQVGCFNNCGFCSKFSVCKSEYWDLPALRNIICALKYTAKNYTNDDLLLAWDRKEHRVGVVFPYLNNDIAAYPYLEEYVDLCYKELGARTRISTVGFSRHNKVLNDMHKRICEKEIYALAGVRLSVSQYGRVWEDVGNNNSINDYVEDLANFLSIYKPYYDKFGAGNRKMCVELRYNPLVVNSEVFEFTYNNKLVICTGNYLFVSVEDNVELEETYITDPYKHSLNLSNDGVKFREYNLDFTAKLKEEIIDYLNRKDIKEEKEVEIYLFNNRDGKYFSINPKLTSEGNYSMCIYPVTDVRKRSGYIITERFLLNALYNFKKKKGYELKDELINTTFDDCYEVVNILKEYAKYYEEISKVEKSEYIKNNIIPIIDIYIKVLKKANYSSDVFFNKNFTIDTGIICNLGRALAYFKGLTSFVNEPLTPIHERNYGRHCSTMKEENCVWLLGCDYDDNIVMEKLELFNTASTKGQLSFKKVLKIEGINANINSESKYLYPGESK